MSNLKKIIISISSFSLGIAIIVYSRGDKNKSVKENVQDNLHLVNQYVDQGKEKVKKLLKNEEDIFLFDYSASPFILYIIVSILFSIFNFCKMKKETRRALFEKFYNGSMIGGLLKITTIAFESLKESEYLKLFSLNALLNVLIVFIVGEGFINLVIYLITCLVRKVTFKNIFHRRLVVNRFYCRSWGNLFIFVVYSIVVRLIFEVLFSIQILGFIVASFGYNQEQKKAIADSNNTVLNVLNIIKKYNKINIKG